MLNDLKERWPTARLGMVNAITKKPRTENGYHDWPDEKGKLTADKRWGVIPGSMSYVVFDVDHDHDIADKLLRKEFGPPSAKVQSRVTGSHYWYPSSGDIPNAPWLCGDIRGTNGYIILWDIADLLEQLAGNGTLRRLSLADIQGAKSLRPRPKTKIETMLSHVEPDEYETWLRVGMALKSDLGDDGLNLWAGWSRQSDKFKYGECEKKWRGFDDEGRISLGTLYYLACEGGYRPQGGRPSSANGVAPTLDKIVRVGTGADLTWELTKGDVTVRMTQTQLCTQARFRIAWHAATGQTVRVKPAAWDEAISSWWDRAEVVDAPDLDGVIWSLLEQFCTDAPSMNRDALLHGTPYDEDGMTWFPVLSLHQYLVSSRCSVPVQRVWGAIRAHLQPVQPVRKTIVVKGKQIRCCGVPSFPQQDSDFDVPATPNDGDIPY